MGVKVGGARAAGGRLRVDLFGPGMTALHRAGVAGLWMTLRRLEAEAATATALRELGGWARDDRGVELWWAGDGKAFFAALFAASFRVHKSGLIHLAGLGDPMDQPQHALALHRALLGTFLQHGRTRKADSSTAPGGVVVFAIEDDTIRLTFQRVRTYAHQESNFTSGGTTDVAGWLYPGAVQRHVALAETRLEEPPTRALALRYAPIGAIFFLVQSRRRIARPQFCVVLPRFDDLAEYADFREQIAAYPWERFHVAGPSAAALRVLAEEEARGLLRRAESATCRVMAFGVVPWSTQQKTRTQVFGVRVGSRTGRAAFRLADHVFRAELRRSEKGELWWSTPQCPELIAANAAADRPWWEGFSGFLGGMSKDDRAWLFRLERGGLGEMVASEDAFPDGPERAFVRACHEAWRRRQGQIGERSRRDGLNFDQLSKREFDRLRIAFGRCKNAAMFRQTVTDFWARGGAQPALQTAWEWVLPFLDERRWQAGRDLALLALASYRGGQTGGENGAGGGL